MYVYKRGYLAVHCLKSLQVNIHRGLDVLDEGISALDVNLEKTVSLHIAFDLF